MCDSQGNVCACHDTPQPCSNLPRMSRAGRRYGCSKWATEVQLQQLNSHFGVPVSVFRCGMILAHSK